MARPVRECKSSKKCLKHFFDTLSVQAVGLHAFWCFQLAGIVL